MSKDGGPAFPQGEVFYRGLSVRDYFASAALPLVMKSDMYNDAMVARQQGGQTFNDALAAQCYQIADSMIAEREKS